MELQTKKRELEAEARSYESEIEQLQSVVKDHLDALGRDKAKINGYHCSRTFGPARPRWKDKITEVIGSEAVAEIVAATPRSIKLLVEPA